MELFISLPNKIPEIFISLPNKIPEIFIYLYYFNMFKKITIYRSQIPLSGAGNKSMSHNCPVLFQRRTRVKIS